MQVKTGKRPAEVLESGGSDKSDDQPRRKKAKKVNTSNIRKNTFWPRFPMPAQRHAPNPRDPKNPRFSQISPGFPRLSQISPGCPRFPQVNLGFLGFGACPWAVLGNLGQKCFF